MNGFAAVVRMENDWRSSGVPGFHVSQMPATLMIGSSQRTRAGLEKAAAGDIEAFTTLAGALADRTKSLMALAWVAELAQLRLVCVLSHLEERQ
jgi:hypothetical protein